MIIADESRNRRSRWMTVITVAALLGLSGAEIRRMNRPYEHDYHGHLLAWFALMSENMVQDGFVETRFMPVLNPEPETYPNFRWYCTHPVLDVVLRAALVKVFGPHEWVMRLQGLVGCFGAALLLFFIAKELGMAPAAAGAAVFGMVGVPLFLRLAHLSMHHPMTLFSGLLAILCYLRLREGRRPLSALLLPVALLAGMQFDWAGYFVPLILWMVEILTRRRPAYVFGIPVLVFLSILWVWIHVDLIARVPRGLLEALRSAAVTQVESLSPAQWFERVWQYQLFSYGWVAIGAVGFAGLVSLRSVSALKTRFLPWLAALAWGALNLAAFPSKAPFHDFWGCYWLPLAGLSFGITAEVLIAVLKAVRIRNAPWLVLGFSIGIAAALLIMTPENELAIASGRKMKETAAAVRAMIPPEDRGVIVSNYKEGRLDPLIFAAYTRMNVDMVPGLTAEGLPGLRARLRVLFRHVRGRPVIFALKPPLLGQEVEDLELARALSRVGKPYKNYPRVYDLTDFVWNNPKR